MRSAARLIPFISLGSQPSFAIFGAKTTGMIIKTYHDQPLLKPLDDPKISMSDPTKMPRLGFQDHQEVEFKKFIEEDRSNLFSRGPEALCKSSNQDFLFLFRSADNMMRESVSNFKGPLGTDVCWWMTDFQFNYLFLTYVNPRAPKPDRRGDAHDMAAQFKKIDAFLDHNKLPAPMFLDLEGPAAHTLLALKTSATKMQGTPKFYSIQNLDSNASPTMLSFLPDQNKFIANMSWGSISKVKVVNGVPQTKMHEPKVYLDHPERYRTIKTALDNFCKAQAWAGPARLQIPKEF